MTFEQAKALVPEGFHPLVKSAYDMLDVVKTIDPINHAAEINHVYEFKGSLIIIADNIENPIHKELWMRVIYSIRGQSMKTCRVCGKKGQRRRYFRERHALCFTHFVEAVEKYEKEFYKTFIPQTKTSKISKIQHYEKIGKEIDEFEKLTSSK